MSLSCSCGEWDGEGWGFDYPQTVTTFHGARSKCCSCKKIIKTVEQCVEFTRMELDEHGDEKWLSSWFMCQHCGEIYLNLTDIGYCLDLNEYMDDELEEYHKLTGFTKKE